jgi:hypothetical protein
MSVQIILALAVLRLKERGNRRPLKIIWSREESMIGHCKRHPMKFTPNGAQNPTARCWPPKPKSSAMRGPTCTPATRCWATP